MAITEVRQDTNFVESNALLTLNLAYSEPGDVYPAIQATRAYLVEHCTPHELDVLESAASSLKRACAEAKWILAGRADR